jgi:arginyl-tRNA synthetase
MDALIDPIRRAIADVAGLAEDEIRVEQPRDPKLGDFAFPCFPLAKARKEAPPKIAAELRDSLAAALPGVAVDAAGPYLNFRYEPPALADTILGAIEAQGARYGGSEEGAGRTIVIDLSSPNIAKPMHVGHLRSTIIGAAVQRLHALLGYRTVGINHIGDWGSQFGKLVVAIERWGETVDLEDDPIRSLLALYVRFHEEAKTNADLEEAARAAFRELESGVDGPVRATWRHLTELSLREFQKVYDRLGVTFDLVRGEAYYEPHLDQTVDRVVSSGVTEESEGALIVDLSSIREGMAPCLLRKTDGTTLYATRDLAAAFERWDEFAFERCLYVVGSDQILHFEQLKGVLLRMGLEWEPRVEHVPFGMMKLPEGKLSTREGKVVFLEDVLDRAVEGAREIILEKNPDLPELERIAEEVGVGAIVFNDLKRERVRDVVFQWDEVLTFEGETGPYVQYSHARLASIERKAAERGEGGDSPDLAILEDARHLLLALGRFPAVVESAATRAEPSEVSQYLLSLCRDLNSWYAKHRVLGEDPPVTAARLRLVRAARGVLANGLSLLGVAAPEAM